MTRYRAQIPTCLPAQGAHTGFCCAETECDGGKAPCSPLFAGAAKAR